MSKPVDINKECEDFCIAIGGADWGDIQVNSMNTAFYAGALVAFNLVTDCHESRTENEAIMHINGIYADIMKNLNQQRDIMAKQQNDAPSITCPKCEKTSYSKGDIDNKYCGNCNEYHSKES